LQGRGVTVVHSLSQQKQVVPNTPTSVDVPLYEVRQRYMVLIFIRQHVTATDRQKTEYTKRTVKNTTKSTTEHGHLI